jgi:hypothetical protein
MQQRSRQASNRLDKRLNRRALVVLLMFFSAVVLPPSGIALHLTDASHVQTARHILMTIHNTAAIIFLSSMSVHLAMNWRGILRYIISGSTGYMMLRREAMAAAIAVVGIVGLALSHVFHVGG